MAGVHISSLLPADLHACRPNLDRLRSRPRQAMGPPCCVSRLRASHEAEVDAPNHTDRAPEHNPLVDWNPDETDQTDRRPEFVAILEHWPQLLLTILPNHIPSTLRA